MMKLGEKIKSLRKQKNISQEVLANYLGVSFQAVSKWETENSMPDITLIPAIASFFRISTDELLDYNVYMIEKEVEAIVDEYAKYLNKDEERSEQIIREGLRKYPGNDVLLNCLVNVLPVPERSKEVIGLCRVLIESTRYDDVKYDAYRLLAKAYKAIGEYASAKEAIEQIPEIYFTKLGVAAELLEGEDMAGPAQQQKRISFSDTIQMYERMADYYEAVEEKALAITQLKTAVKLIQAVKEDTSGHYSRSLYEVYSEKIPKLEERITFLEMKTWKGNDKA